MTVKEFVKKYNEYKTDELKSNFLQKVVLNEYVPFTKKEATCKNIVDTTYYITDNKGIKRLHVNSSATYILYSLNIINLYTGIEIDFNRGLEEYDELNRYGLIGIISSMISERELKEFSMILDMVESDVIQNEYETHAFISSQIERFGTLIGNALDPVLTELSDSINNIDETKIEKITNKIKQFIK